MDLNPTLGKTEDGQRSEGLMKVAEKFRQAIPMMQWPNQIPGKTPVLTCEACDAGYPLAPDGLHYDPRDVTWGVCRKVVAAIRAAEKEID